MSESVKVLPIYVFSQAQSKILNGFWNVNRLNVIIINGKIIIGNYMIEICGHIYPSKRLQKPPL